MNYASKGVYVKLFIKKTNVCSNLVAKGERGKMRMRVMMVLKGRLEDLVDWKRRRRSKMKSRRKMLEKKSRAQVTVLKNSANGGAAKTPRLIETTGIREDIT